MALRGPWPLGAHRMTPIWTRNDIWTREHREFIGGPFDGAVREVVLMRGVPGMVAVPTQAPFRAAFYKPDDRGRMVFHDVVALLDSP